MSDCVFCDIVAGSAPATVVREWPDALAFVPLNPVVDGHILVVPKVHIADAIQDPAVTAATTARAAELAADFGSSNILTSVGQAATQSIFHLHVHVIRRAPGDRLMVPWGTTGDPHDPHSCRRSEDAERRATEAMAEAEQLQAKVAEWERVHAAHIEVEDLGEHAVLLWRQRAKRAEAAIERHHALINKMRHGEYPFGGSAADSADILAAALDQADAEDGEEPAQPVDWQAIAQQRERELKTAGEARHQAEAAIERVRRTAQVWIDIRPDYPTATRDGHTIAWGGQQILAALNPAGGSEKKEDPKLGRDCFEIGNYGTETNGTWQQANCFRCTNCGAIGAQAGVTHPDLAQLVAMTERHECLPRVDGTEEKEDPKPCCDLHNPVVCESDEPGMDGPCCENCPSWPPAEGRAP